MKSLNYLKSIKDKQNACPVMLYRFHLKSGSCHSACLQDHLAASIAKEFFQFFVRKKFLLSQPERVIRNDLEIAI